MNNTVLVVDDEPSIRRFVEFVLERAGFVVLEASDGQEALDILQKARPAVCLLDVMMPKLSGYQVCEMIKADPELRSIHVMMLTAKGQQSARERAYDAGCDEYLVKPFSPTEIAKLVRAACERDAAKA